MTTELPIALVTGGNRGIGFDVCRQLAEQGYAVILSARDSGKASDAARALGKQGLQVTPLQLDVNRAESVTRARDAVEREHGRLDALVNNAGVDYDTDQDVLTADLERVARIIDTNTLGPWRVAKAFIPLLRKSDHGRIVNVSSGAGALASMNGSRPGYALSKAALNALTLMLAGMLERDRILVNAICPGWVATAMGGEGGRPIPAGAASVVWGVTLPDDGPTGGFFRDGRAVEW